MEPQMHFLRLVIFFGQDQPLELVPESRPGAGNKSFGLRQVRLSSGSTEGPEIQTLGRQGFRRCTRDVYVCHLLWTPYIY